MKKTIFLPRGSILLLAFFFLGACSHPLDESWLDKASLDFHGDSSLKCANCHNLNTECSECHFDASGSKSPSDWIHGMVSHDQMVASEPVCNRCHGLNHSYGNEPGSCHDCHDTEPEQHESPNTDCTGCHQSNLQDTHSNNCDLCHESAAPEVQDAILTDNKDCDACHTLPPHAESCRNCHDDPDVVGPTPNVDRHHLLCGNPLPQGECSVNHNACLSDANCDPGICSNTSLSQICTVDGDCPESGLGETCGEICIGETVIPILDTNQDGVNDTHYGCLNCHEQAVVGGVITFLVERDCLQCHIQVPGDGSVHHLTATAQGIDSP